MERILKKGLFSVKGVFALRNMLVMALMVALAAVLGQFTLYITPTFKGISFAYLPGAMVAALYGPWAALAFGLVSDTVVFFANPQGGYFPGYAISEMTAYFIYALFFYRRPVTYLRALLARGAVLAVVVFGLNYQWNVIMSGTAAASYYTGVRVINNLVQWPVHALLITYMAKLVLNIHARTVSGMVGTPWLADRAGGDAGSPLMGAGGVARPAAAGDAGTAVSDAAAGDDAVNASGISAAIAPETPDTRG